MDGLAKHSNGVSVGVKYEIADFDGGRGPLGSATQMGADPGEQFLDDEWLGYVVVGSGVQSFFFF